MEGDIGGTQYRKTVRKISKYWQESANEPCGSAVKGLPLPNTISQKDKKKLHPTGIGDTVIPQIKTKITEKPLEK